MTRFQWHPRTGWARRDGENGNSFAAQRTRRSQNLVRFVSVFMDVEDPVNPAADDAAQDLAELFTTAGIRGSFCVTGEKWRVLRERGRDDVIQSLKRHCLGLHSDTHSRHPTTMELLAPTSMAEGVPLATADVAAAKASIPDATFWGGAGNTWSPEIATAVSNCGIPAYSYALTEVPGQHVHRFEGCLAFPQHISIDEGAWARTGSPLRRKLMGWHGLPGRLLDAQTHADRAIASIRTCRSPWVGIFVGHPTRLRHTRFWDTDFSHGVTPEALTLAPEQCQTVYEASLENMLLFLRRLKSGFEVIGVDEAADLTWSFRKPNDSELAHFRAATAKNIRAAGRWPIHAPGLDVENIVEKTLSLESTLEIGSLKAK